MAETFTNVRNATKLTAKHENSKIIAFIVAFNKAIDKGENYINSSLDKVGHLSDSEFASAKIMAKQQGWKLTQFDDNYQTTSYKIEAL